MTESTCQEIQAAVYFLTSDEGGGGYPVEVLETRKYLYRLLADFGLGYKEGFKKLCSAQLVIDGLGSVELGVEHTLRLQIACLKHVVRPGAEFCLMEGPKKVVGRGTVLSLFEEAELLNE